MIYLELYVESFSEQTQIKLLFSLNFTVQDICANEYMQCEIKDTGLSTLLFAYFFVEKSVAFAAQIICFSSFTKQNSSGWLIYYL